MYYLEMKTLIKPESKLENFLIKNQTCHIQENTNSSITSIDRKFYQKLFMVLSAFFTLLIFPESPKELETVCESYYSNNRCNVW